MSGKLVLIVDDEEPIRELLSLYFTKENFTVFEAADGAEALVKTQQYKPDIILLDIMMPVLDGMEVCQQIRKFSSVPIIMLTSKNQDEDRILGLELGADDYVSKPFNPKEVVARVKAVLRRSPDCAFTTSDRVSLPELEVNMQERTVVAFGQMVQLANKELDLLWRLAKHPGKVFTREQLLELIWGYSYCGDTRTVDTHVKRIRKKVGANSSTAWDIKTVWAIGYKFEVRR